VKILLTAAEAAQRLSLKESTIRKMILERRISYVKIRRSVRIPEDVIDRLIQEGMRRSVE